MPPRRLREAGALVALLVVSSGCLDRALAGTRLYDNTGNPANTYYSAQGGAEAIDDLHLVSAGSLDSVVFEYFEPRVGAPFTATVNLYANPGGLDLDALPLAGPFVASGLPGGRGAIALPLPPGLTVGRDLWVGVRFSSSTAGLVINDVPAAGTSHDFYLEQGGFYWFNGNPKANFGLRLVGTPDLVSVGAPAPLAMTLAAPDPNPFHHQTTLRFTLPHPGPVRVDVWDVSGRRIRTLLAGRREAGQHAVRWSGRDEAGEPAAAGVYLVRLQWASEVSVRRVVLIR